MWSWIVYNMVDLAMFDTTRNGSHDVQKKCGAEKEISWDAATLHSRLEPKDRTVWTGALS